MKNDTYEVGFLPAALVALSCLLVAGTVGYAAAKPANATPVNVTTNIYPSETPVNVTLGPAEAESEPADIVMPTTHITARYVPKSDPLSGPSKRCSDGAWFNNRPLVQGSGNVRGFCP